MLTPGGHRRLIKDIACLYTKWSDRVVRQLREAAEQVPFDGTPHAENEKDTLLACASSLESVQIKHNMMHLRGKPVLNFLYRRRLLRPRPAAHAMVVGQLLAMQVTGLFVACLETQNTKNMSDGRYSNAGLFPSSSLLLGVLGLVILVFLLILCISIFF